MTEKKKSLLLRTTCKFSAGRDRYW